MMTEHRFVSRLAKMAILVAIMGITANGATASERFRGGSSAIKSIIIEEAVRSGVVPPALALAVAKVESNYDADALSAAGARGVMQVMPATARSVFGVRPERLWEPRTNIRVGMCYLARLYQRYGHRWHLALSHYNGGPLRWRGYDWVPHPYTREYVSEVTLQWNRFAADRTVHRLIADARRTTGRTGKVVRFPVDRCLGVGRVIAFDDDSAPRFDQVPRQGWQYHLHLADRLLNRASDIGYGANEQYAGSPDEHAGFMWRAPRGSRFSYDDCVWNGDPRAGRFR